MTRTELQNSDIVGIRAANPGPLTLTGTNTWVVGRDPAWVIDPGPDLDEHLEAVGAEVTARDGLGGIALTHSHGDHTDAVPGLLERFDAPVVSYATGLREGDRVGPLVVLELPGHAADHLVFLSDGVAFSGDAVLGEGSVFISPDPGALIGYLAGLERLRVLSPRLIAPGHGPLITDPAAKLTDYIEHRLDREQKLIAGLGAGARSVADLLDAAWPEVPDQMRVIAEAPLAAHLDKLEAEGRLPDGVERPDWPPPWLPTEH